MTRNLHSDASIAAWLTDGPDRLSASRRAAVKAAIRTTRQTHLIVLPLPERRSVHVLLAAAALLLLSVALVAFAGSNRLFTTEVPQPTGPTSTAVVTRATDHPGRIGKELLEGAARSFTVDYEIPAGVDLRPMPDPLREEPRAAYFTLGGMPVFVVQRDDTLGTDPTPPLWPRGVAIADITAATTHMTRGELVLDDAASFVRSLRGLELVSVGPPEPATLGGVPAIAVDVSGWHIDGPYLSFEYPSRMTVADLGDAIVVVQVWAGTWEALRAWQVQVQPFVDSLRFRVP